MPTFCSVSRIERKHSDMQIRLRSYHNDYCPGSRVDSVASVSSMVRVEATWDRAVPFLSSQAMCGEGVMRFTTRVEPTVVIILHITVHSAAIAVCYEDLRDNSCSDDSKLYSHTCTRFAIRLNKWAVHEHIIMCILLASYLCMPY